MENKPNYPLLKSLKTATAKRCDKCGARIKLYRETKYLAPVFRCTGCGRTEDIVLPEEPVKHLEFK